MRGGGRQSSFSFTSLKMLFASITKTNEGELEEIDKKEKAWLPLFSKREDRKGSLPGEFIRADQGQIHTKRREQGKEKWRCIKAVISWVICSFLCSVFSSFLWTTIQSSSPPLSSKDDLSGNHCLSSVFLSVSCESFRKQD